MADIPILYEDENVLAINKPAGLSVHPAVHPAGNRAPGDAAAKPDPTLSEILVAAYPELAGVGEPMVIENGPGGLPLTIDRPGIVHRLDKETSGVMLVAKNQETFLFLKNQFQNREIKKTYHAILYGWLKEDAGTVRTVISRSKSNIRMWVAGKGGRGTEREAVTKFEVLRRFSTNADPDGDRTASGRGSTEDGDYTYAAFYPETGRTHQIRVHARHLNHAIVCDSLYAPKRPCALGFRRLALHAKEITFRLPNTADGALGGQKTVFAPLPADFEAALDQDSAAGLRR